MNFTEIQKNDITEKWGNEFFLKILDNINLYSQQWELYDFEYGKITLHNLILYCKSKQWGNCVIKFYGEMWEYNALHEYSNSKKYCKLYEFDPKTRVLLIERIIPGNMLKDEPSLDKRISVFAELFTGLHLEPKHPNKSMSYLKMMYDVTGFMEKSCEENKELCTHAKKAKELFIEISSAYDKEVLLHWDLHNENILLGQNGSYKIIDPFGFIGAPVLDVGRFISKECFDAIPENRIQTVEKITDYFETTLKIPKSISKQCLYIDIVFLNCHWVERGESFSIDEVRFAESVLNSCE